MVERKDLEAALHARHELGPEYEPQIVDAFLERLDRRIDERLRERAPREQRSDRSDRAVPIVSLALAIPLTAIAGGLARLAGIALVWGAIVLVNLAYALRR